MEDHLLEVEQGPPGKEIPPADTSLILSLPLINASDHDTSAYYRVLLEEHEKIKEDLRLTKDEKSKLILDVNSVEERREKDVKERDEQIAALVKEKSELRNHSEKIRLDLQRKLENLQRQWEAASKEKESIVVKFAQREHSWLKLEQQKEALEKRLSDFGRERDSLLQKVKALNGEKSRACEIVDQKCAELLAVKRDVSQMKDEISARDAKLRAAETKLKEERENHKETQSRFDKLSQRLKEQKEEFDLRLKDIQDALKNYQAAEANKVVQKDEERMEQCAKLIVEKQQKEQEQTNYKQLIKEFEALNSSNSAVIAENGRLHQQVESLSNDRLRLEENLSTLQGLVHELEVQNSTYLVQMSELETLKIQIAIEQEQCGNFKIDVARLSEQNIEIKEESDLCRRKEGEALRFSQKLTEMNVQLQSDLATAERKAETCQEECRTLVADLEFLRSQLTENQKKLELEAKKRMEETQLLAAKVAEKSLEVESLRATIGDQAGEMSIMRKKHAASLKEMSREISRVRRKDGTESVSNNSHGDANSLGSRASSNSSLNTVGLHSSDSANRSSPSPTHTHPQPASAPEENGHVFHLEDLTDKQQFLVDKIVKLQRASARKSEKIDFLEEHVRTLTGEVRKKNRILLCYFMKEETGGVTSEKSDRSKIEMAKHGGVMASVYSSKVHDDSMSLDLSLEINRKLQGLLEDTLLKNIMLKNSMPLANQTNHVQEMRSYHAYYALEHAVDLQTENLQELIVWMKKSDKYSLLGSLRNLWCCFSQEATEDSRRYTDYLSAR